MVNQDASTRLHDRAYLLSESKRNDVLELSEVERYGLDSYGDPGYVSIYGLRPKDWYARGIRLLARTAVECTRDGLADLIGADISALAARAPQSESIVIDPFAGSANTLYWISRHVRARAAVGFELDTAVYDASKRNLSILGLGLTLTHGPYETGLTSAIAGDNDLVIVYVAPPWGDALDRSSGLDLRQTTPPIVDVIDHVRATFVRHNVIVAVQLYETVVIDSFRDASSRGDWATSLAYDVDPAGRNHGLLLMTLGWIP
jgi:16S rRNA G966 N2-methylase RsmD